MNVVAVLTRSRVGRHLAIYGFGAGVLSLLKQGRHVIETGFQLLDHFTGRGLPESDTLPTADNSATCPSCGAVFTDVIPAQCPHCGAVEPPESRKLAEPEPAGVIPPPPPSAPTETDQP